LFVADVADVSISSLARHDVRYPFLLMLEIFLVALLGDSCLCEVLLGFDIDFVTHLKLFVFLI
jgi:hypothetical protein